MIGSYEKYAKYKNKEYLLTNNEGSNIISTYKIENTDEQFIKCKSDSYLYRTIDIDELMDIYRYQLVAIYDSKISNVSREWDLTTYVANIEEKRVKLSLQRMGPFNGWTVHDRDFHTKWVDISELEGAKIRYIYEKKNGIEYNPPLIEEKNIEVSDLYKYFQHYENI